MKSQHKKNNPKAGWQGVGGAKGRWNEQKTTSNIVDLNIATIIIKLTAYTLQSKGRDCQVGFLKSKYIMTCCVQETQLQYKDINRLKDK